MTDGRTRYDIYKEGVRKILEAKGRVDVVEAVEAVEPNDTKIHTEKIEDYNNS
jgi:hypothetical protein